jgi:CRP-like cAMP-binding protein
VGQIVTAIRPRLPTEARSNRLLAALGPRDCEELSRHLQAVELRRGAILMEPGEPVPYVWFPHNAVASLTAVLADGGMVESATIGREGAVGLITALGDCHAASYALVQVTGSASRIEQARFRAAFEASPALRRVCLLYNEALMAQILQSVACSALHSVEARFCRRLLMLQDRIGRDPLKLTHQALAEMLGVQRSTLTVVAQTLQHEGVIRYHRGLIEILDRRRLESSACECYRTARATLERLLPSGVA